MFERCIVNSTLTHTNPDLTKEERVATCKIDNHADTCCLGPNFVLIYFTGKVCNVSSFLQDLPNQEATPICTGTTAYEDSYGQMHIIVINEALWFGDRMEASLINPNQIRAHGLQSYDDPADPNRDLGLQVNHLTLPFTMKGTTCSFTLRTPIAWELDNCPHLEVTSDMEWQSEAVHFFKIQRRNKVAIY